MNSKIYLRYKSHPRIQKNTYIIWTSKGGLLAHQLAFLQYLNLTALKGHLNLRNAFILEVHIDASCRIKSQRPTRPFQKCVPTKKIHLQTETFRFSQALYANSEMVASTRLKTSAFSPILEFCNEPKRQFNTTSKISKCQRSSPKPCASATMVPLLKRHSSRWTWVTVKSVSWLEKSSYYLLEIQPWILRAVKKHSISGVSPNLPPIWCVQNYYATNINLQQATKVINRMMYLFKGHKQAKISLSYDHPVSDVDVNKNTAPVDIVKTNALTINSKKNR